MGSEVEDWGTDGDDGERTGELSGGGREGIAGGAGGGGGGGCAAMTCVDLH